MNLLLLQDDDFDDPQHRPITSPLSDRVPAVSVEGRATIRGDRVTHLRKILKLKPGDQVLAGVLNGPIGHAVVIAIDQSMAEVEFALSEAPPESLDVELCVALPRPKFVGRILQHATTFGVKSICLFQSARVEKSYWSSAVLTEESLHRHLCLGLEQARDTVLPHLHLLGHFNEFNRFAQQAIERGRSVLLADAQAVQPFPRRASGPHTVVIGPEGGLVAQELTTLADIGCKAVSLGQRPLRVETAVSACLSRLLP